MCLFASLCAVLFQDYEGVRESLNSKKNTALMVKSVDSNMNKKSKKKKKEEEIELPSKKTKTKMKNFLQCMPDSSSALLLAVIDILTQTSLHNLTLL